MQDEKPDYCVKCHVHVVKGDPERVANQHGTFHGGCWKAVKKLQTELAKLQPRYQYVQ